MNKVVKELAQKAYDFSLQTDGTPYGEVYDEKFAELLVRYCAELCSTLDGGENMFSRGIRKHFGVKE